MSPANGPRLRVGNVHELPWLRTREQRNSDGTRSAVQNRIVASDPMFVACTRYEPGMMLARQPFEREAVLALVLAVFRVVPIEVHVARDTPLA